MAGGETTIPQFFLVIFHHQQLSTFHWQHISELGDKGRTLVYKIIFPFKAFKALETRGMYIHWAQKVVKSLRSASSILKYFSLVQKFTFKAFLQDIVKLYFDKHVKLSNEEFQFCAQSQLFELSEHIDMPTPVSNMALSWKFIKTSYRKDSKCHLIKAISQVIKATS